MKILFNASNLVIGGGIQVARSLFIELQAIGNGVTIHAVVSPEVSAVLPSDANAEVVFPSPAKLLMGQRTRRKLKSIERRFAPDVTLTVFGPAYWRPDAPHVCGFAEPWVFTANSFAWKTRSFMDQLLVRLKCLYKELNLKYNKADAFILETRSMAEAVRKHFPHRKTFVVPNNCGQAFDARNPNNTHPHLPAKGPEEFRVVTLTQYYPHKQLELIPQVAAQLKNRRPGRRIRFLLSLPSQGRDWLRLHSKAAQLSVSDMIQTVGTVHPTNAPSFYLGADAMLLPTVLESFSANYPEAMAMGVPIVTTGLPFARNICENAALYFAPMHAEDAADQLLKLITAPHLSVQLANLGHKQHQKLPTPPQKARMVLDVCRTVLADKQS